jgi:magnesium-protoporphyrin O-methyltransferase
MTCCQVPVADTSRFFSRFARWHRLRHQLLGFERSQRQLIEGVRQAGVEEASVLEIGCGPGYVHQALLRCGAASAVGVELSVRMLQQARLLAKRQGLTQCTSYRHGDFVELASELEAADVTILDKVVCCYPNAEMLLRLSLERTRKAYALTYPRDRLITRLGVRLAGQWLMLLGSQFRPYVHDPRRIERTILATGFEKLYSRATPVWLTQIYVRAAASH